MRWLSMFATGSCSACSSLSLLVLRLSLGGFMAFGHGYGKLISFAEKSASFPDPLGVGHRVSMALAIFAEFLCSLLLMLGLGTRLILIPLLVTMGVAAFVVHGADDFNTREKALLYLAPYVALLFAGPGRFSLDALIFKNQGSPSK